MSFSNRLHHVAIGGCLIGLLTASGALYAENNPKQQKQTAPANSAQQQPAAKAAATAPERKEAVKTDWNKTECQNPQSHNEADLCEQRRMSEAAERSVFLSKVQIILGAAGALLLVWTLIESRRAASAAMMAATAAISVERAWLLPTIESENIEEVIRAWTGRSLEYKDGALRLTGDDPPIPVVTYYFKNMGKTPAFLKSVSAKILASPQFPPLQFDDDPLPRDHVVEPDGTAPRRDSPDPTTRTFRKEFNGLSGSDLEALAAYFTISIASHLWFYGQVKYDDVWGSERVTRFCLIYDRQTKRLIRHGNKPYNENT